MDIEYIKEDELEHQETIKRIEVDEEVQFYEDFSSSESCSSFSGSNSGSISQVKEDLNENKETPKIK